MRLRRRWATRADSARPSSRRPPAVRGLAATEPACCLGLLYQAPCPLSLHAAFGTEREREAMLADPGEYGVGLELWNPAEYEHAPAFAAGAGDADYEEAAALLLQEWRMTDDDLAGFKLLARVCARLNADPRLELPRTADFVVFANDPEIPDQAHIERHLRACIPRDIFKRLKKRGLFYVEP